MSPAKFTRFMWKRFTLNVLDAEKGNAKDQAMSMVGRPSMLGRKNLAMARAGSRALPFKQSAIATYV